MPRSRPTGSGVIPPPPPPTTGRPNRRLIALLGVLVIASVGLAISRRLIQSAPKPPDSKADQATRQRYYLARIKSNPADSDAYVQLGRIDVERSYYMAALDCFVLARKLGAPDRATAEMIGRCYAHLRRADEARDELHRAQVTDPDSVDAAIDLADLEANFTGQTAAQNVMRHFLERRRALMERPSATDEATLLALASECSRIGDAEDAVTLSRSAIAVAPKDPTCYAFLGRSLLVLNRIEDATAAAGKAVELAPDQSDLHALYGAALMRTPGRTAESVAQLERAVSLNNANGPAYRSLGQAHAALRHWREAAAAFLRAATLEPDERVELFQLTARMARNSGDAILAADCAAQADLLAGDYENALRQLQKLASSSDPVSRRKGMETTAEVYRRMKRPKEYLSLVNQLATGATAQDDAHLADAYGQIGDMNQQAVYLKKALDLDPKLASGVHFHLGQNAEAQGRRDEAETEFEQAVQYSPDNQDYRRELVRIYLTRLDIGDHIARAQRQAEEVVSSKTAGPEDYHNLGIIYRAAKRTHQAIQSLQHAVDLAPEATPAYLDLGQLYQQTGKLAEAKKMLKLYRNVESVLLEQRNLTARANAEPGNPAVQAALGDFYAANHAFPQAGAQYRKAAALAPGNAQYHAGLARVDRQLGLLDEATEQEALLPSSRSRISD